MSVPPSDTLKASLRCRTQSPDFQDWDLVLKIMRRLSGRLFSCPFASTMGILAAAA